MSENTSTENAAEPAAEPQQLEHGTYEVIQSRLKSHAAELRKRLEKLNADRRDVFGSIPTELVSTQRITTENNCTAADMVAIGDQFIFGYNVHLGLRSTTALSDVFAVYSFTDGDFHHQQIDLITDGQFEDDFSALYKYYKDTRFQRFHRTGPHLFFIFQTGKSTDDTKSFKFVIDGDRLRYVDNRSHHEITAPDQHDFRWRKTTREMHRGGAHPHISIDDLVFVETVGGDLTIKIEDNTDDGSGIYAEPVDDADQTLDDAEIFYAIVGNVILLKIKPFKEDAFRYLVFNQKKQTAQRLDSIADACILLPEDHGLIFSNGYYLQTGVTKTFDNNVKDLAFDRRVASPNGEDYLYVFHNRTTGEYVLLAYNMIEQEVATPIVCNGFSIFDDGMLVYFRSDTQPQKHHGLQIWRTPFLGQEIPVGEQTDSYLYKIGNKEIVRAMAESHELLNLIGQDDSYANLYLDLVKKTTDLIDSYFWINQPETGDLGNPLTSIRTAATAAVDEFDKVVRIRKATETQFKTASQEALEAVSNAATKQFRHIDDFVDALTKLRTVRGQVISLKELKYVDVASVESLETKIAQNTDRLSQKCVDFLLRDDALAPYQQRVDDNGNAIDGLKTAQAAKALDEEISLTGSALEMLIDIVSNLKIEDATQRTRIIDNISSIYSSLNQARAQLKKKSQALMSVEGVAEFNSQIKLISQAVVNYLDVCDTPAKCDEYLTKMMVQVEELEGRFSEFDDFILQLSEKRDEIYAAFDTRKIQLTEAQSKRANVLRESADRILKGIRSRVSGFKTVDEINSYFATDLMIDKVRDIVDQLGALGESVKVDDLQSRLKTLREDAVGQLRDKNELFVDGQNIIQFGKYKFTVNVQPLELTTVKKQNEMFFHLSGTHLFEAIDNQKFAATRSVWDQSLVSENGDVYRAEYLCRQILEAAEAPAEGVGTGFQTATTPSLSALPEDQLLKTVQQFMATRYAEGYIKGVHDLDAVKILTALLQLEQSLGLLKYTPAARTIGGLAWFDLKTQSVCTYDQWVAKFASLKSAKSIFGVLTDRQKHVDRLSMLTQDFATRIGLQNEDAASEAADYLFDQLCIGDEFVISRPASELATAFSLFIKRKSADNAFIDSITSGELEIVDRYQIAKDWIGAFVVNQSNKNQNDQHENWAGFVDETAAALVDQTIARRRVVDVPTVMELEGLLGDHRRVEARNYRLDYHDFRGRLDTFQRNTVPQFLAYTQLKKDIIEDRREELRLEEFKPRVLTSFIRNRLINDTYLPMVGANLAKQMGVAGEEKRTDLMGMLLLISPPGYGKTTLMEYIANRLGITFMKINGPAIGHQVTSLDPSEAPNASAREEIEKLNLALEMGDNVMIYLDDIQHCNPELLQKFISLCDATRRIEGVFNGKPKTYDLRGRKVAVVMAGNPYTESGQKFQIPDMLASRADTYNLGDVIGDNLDAFELSYLENCLTSNATLAKLSARSRNDVYSIIKMATEEQPQAVTLESDYSTEEINEFRSVMQKLIRARDVVLRVNRQYIQSAAQSDEYRTEPAFKLQGSYRDMNKIAEEISPVMNDDELMTLIHSHYNNQAQTLATGAQANLLKLKELMGELEGADLQRWEDIKRTFQRNLLLDATGDDQLGQVIGQMMVFGEGLKDIRLALEKGVARLTDDDQASTMQTATMREVAHAVAELAKFNETAGEMKELMLQGGATGLTGGLPATTLPPKIEVVNKVPKAFLSVIRNQFQIIQTWMEPILKLSQVFPEAEDLKRAAQATDENYRQILNIIEKYKGMKSDELE